MKRTLLAGIFAMLSLTACGQQEQPAADHSGHSGGATSSPSAAETGGSDMMSEMQKGNEISQDYDFKVSSEKALSAGTPSRLNILVTEKANNLPVRDFTESHEKLMHLILISSDMKEFQHIHPDVTGPGKLQVDTTFPKAGQWVAFAQFARTGGHEATVRQVLSVGDGKTQAPNLVPDAVNEKVVDGYTFKLTSYPQKANEMAMITVAITKDGKPVSGIENYLGAGGHAVVIGEDTNSFLHVHPMTEATNGSYTAPIEFHSLIPKPGRYKLWAQFQIEGKVRTVDFTFEVK